MMIASQAFMRQTVSLIFALSMLVPACRKEEQKCKQAIVSNSVGPCGNWGIVVEGSRYPSSNIPDRFKKDGLQVCASYNLFEDMRMCACCGGTWADITSMEASH